MPIRILHFVDTLGKGGLENGLVNIVERSDPGRFEHVVCAVRGLGANRDRLAERARVMLLNGKQPRVPVRIPAMARAIREVRPDVVHSRNWAAIEAVAAGRWAGSCAVVHSEHGLDSGTGAREPRRRVWFRRLAYQMADRVLSVSCQLRDLHARRTGFPAEKIAVIHNGVDSNRFFPDPAARARVRHELGLSDEEFCIGCVANLNPVKDHPTLLKAVAEFSQECGDWRLLLVGTGPQRPALERLVAEHPNARDRVVFLGLSDRVPALLNAMDVWVLPSLAEGISNALLEAMATGLPVVATDVGGNPEVVVDGQSGLLFPAGDRGKLASHLSTLRARVDLRVQLGKQALRRVREEFSIGSMIRKYERVYESLATAAVPARAGVGG